MQNFFVTTDILPPPYISHSNIDVNLKTLIDTAYLAQHYSHVNIEKTLDIVLILTASIAGFVSTEKSSIDLSFFIDKEFRLSLTISKYAQEFNPLYFASKDGMVNFLYYIVKSFYDDGICANTICPSPIRTNLLASNT